MKNFGNRWPTPVGIGLFPTGVVLQLPKIFQSFDHNSETNQDINLKFSGFVYDLSGLN